MADEFKERGTDEAFDTVQQEKGYSKEMQIECARLLVELGSKKLDVVRDMGGKSFELMRRKEAADVEKEKLKLECQKSILKYNHAKDWLDCARETLRHQFFKEDKLIDDGFKMADKAIEAGEWGVAVDFFGKMTEMVSKSPLASVIEFNEKMKSGNLTLEDF